LQISSHAFILMDVLNVNYDQDDIHLNKWDAYNFIRQEIQTTYKATLSPYHNPTEKQYNKKASDTKKKEQENGLPLNSQITQHSTFWRNNWVLDWDSIFWATALIPSNQFESSHLFITSSRKKSLQNNHPRLIISKTDVTKFYCFLGKLTSKVMVSKRTTPSLSLLPPYHSKVFLMCKMANSRKLVSIKTTNDK